MRDLPAPGASGRVPGLTSSSSYTTTLPSNLLTFSSDILTFEPAILVMAIEEITISSLKQTKNAIIGNPTAKRTLAQDEAFVGT